MMPLHNISFKRVRHSSVHEYEYLKHVLPRSPADEWRRCLDIGCGHDRYIRPVVESLGYQYVGVDHDLSIQPSILVCGDAHRLPFENNVFDVILAIATFEHFHSPWTAMQEVGRVAREKALLFGWVPQLAPFHGDSYFNFTFRGIQRILSIGGFEVVEIKPGGAAGMHFLKCFIAPFQVPRFLAAVIDALFSTALRIRLIGASLFGKVCARKLDERTRHRISSLLEDQRLIFADGLQFIGRKTVDQ